MRNVPDRLRGLDTRSSLVDTVQGGLPGVALQEEGCHWGWTLGAHNCSSVPAPSLCFELVSADMSSQPFALATMPPTMMDSYASGTVRYKRALSSLSCLWPCLYQSNRKVTNAHGRSLSTSSCSVPGELFPFSPSLLRAVCLFVLYCECMLNFDKACF